MQPSFVVSSPTYGSHWADDDLCAFRVAWKINPHMRVGETSVPEAIRQHQDFVKALADAGAQLTRVPFVRGAYDSVFVKDNAILFRTDKGLVSYMGRPLTHERQIEQRQRMQTLAQFGFSPQHVSQHSLEGGDVQVLENGRGALVGYGFRSSLEAAYEFRRALGQDVTPLELKDPYFYHLDTALNVVEDAQGCIVFACREAFTDEAWLRLHRHAGVREVLKIPREEALKFGLNWVEVNDTVFIGQEAPTVTRWLKVLGKKVVVTPLTQYQMAGGSAACLVAKIHPVRSLQLRAPGEFALSAQWTHAATTSLEPQ